MVGPRRKVLYVPTLQKLALAQRPNKMLDRQLDQIDRKQRAKMRSAAPGMPGKMVPFVEADSP
jgi:hypothetical protein